MKDPLRIGIAGLGTVGAGLVRLLTENDDLIAARCGRRIEIVAVAVRDHARDRGFSPSRFVWYKDPVDLAQSEDIQVFVELIGGTDVAGAAVEAALNAGKHVDRKSVV